MNGLLYSQTNNEIKLVLRLVFQNSGLFMKIIKLSEKYKWKISSIKEQKRKPMKIKKYFSRGLI